MISPRYGFGYTLYMICIEGTKALAQSLASLILSSIIIYLTERRGIISRGEYLSEQEGGFWFNQYIKTYEC